jgi:hypothetical protein
MRALLLLFILSKMQAQPNMSERINNNNKAPIKSQDQSQSPPPEYTDQKTAKSCYIVATVTSGCVILLLVLVGSIVQFSSNNKTTQHTQHVQLSSTNATLRQAKPTQHTHCCQGPENGTLLIDT